MLAEHSTEMIRLRARVDVLEEENRQLKEMLGLDDDAGFCIAARAAFGATATQARILQVLVTGAVCRSQSLMAACSRAGESVTDNNLKVQVSKLRTKLEPHAIKIKNEWGIGYKMPPGHRSLALALMASAVTAEAMEVAAQ